MADKATITATSYEQASREIQSNNNYAIGCLLHLYNHQTMDEQMRKGTVHQNNIGFNGNDGGILSSIADFYINREFLTSKQLAVIKKTLPKYITNQILGIPIELKSIKQMQENKSQQQNRVVIDNDLLVIRFAYNADLVGKVKTLSGRRWNAFDKYWTATITVDNLQRLQEWGFDIPTDALAEKEQEIADMDFSALPTGLRQFQVEGIRYIQAKGGRAIIGDEMGLGKTVQALGWLIANRETALPALIVVPASLKLNWKREVEKWIPGTSLEILEGRKPCYSGYAPDITICNYDIVMSRLDELISKKFKTIILDEAHYIKNTKAQRTKAIRALAKKIDNRIPLTGTPIVNRPIEFFNALNLVAPEIFKSFWTYAKTYCGARHNGYGWDFTGATNTEELHNLVTSTCMIRRRKEDVLKELPAKQRIVVPINGLSKEYKRAEANVLAWIKDTIGSAEAAKAKRAEVLVSIEKLKQLAVKSKFKETVNWIRDYIESDQKLVVFATHKEIIDSLMKEFDGIAVKIDGGCSSAQRDDAVQRFQNDDSIKLFIGNIKAAGVGLTLTAASATCFLELGWTPGDHDQAEDRVHRIGQKSDSIHAYYLIAADSIEEKIAALIDEKRKVLDQVLDGRDTEDSNLLTELLNQMI